MEKQKKCIHVAAGREKADLVIRNGKIVHVFSGEIQTGTIAISDGRIAGIGDYQGKEEIDAQGCYILPGLIDSHIHIESSFVTPEEIGRLLIPHGTTTIIADPHEIVNVAGQVGLRYMMDAAENTALEIKYLLPSCVPSTVFEHSGAVLTAADMKELIQDEKILGLGEFMNFPGAIAAEEEAVKKLLVAKSAGKIVDGHAPGLGGKELNAYIAAGIHTDHECSTLEEMKARIRNGMYVQLRQGSACRDLVKLLKGVTDRNSRRCVLCSDDRQPKTIFEEGHIEGHLKICVKEGIDPVTAIQMATINAAECYGLHDRGAIVPGRRADLVLVQDLSNFAVSQVFIEGKLVAKEGRYLLNTVRADAAAVTKSVYVENFSEDRLKLNLKSNRVKAIGIIPGKILTEKKSIEIVLDETGDFHYTSGNDVCKLAVIERHHGTGNLAVGLLAGYGISAGAAGISVSHDSHNIIVAGTNNHDMAIIVQEIMRQQGGAVLVKDGKILESMPLPVGGIMSDQNGEWVDQKLVKMHEIARKELGVHETVDPLMTLCFMALPVIPELKMTDMGLFNVTEFRFTSVEEKEYEYSEI